MNRKFALIALAAAIGFSSAAHAAEYEIRMLNRGERPMVFEPEFVRAQPGDTLRFVAVDPGHNAETIPGMLPEGADPFKGAINEEVVYTVEAEGVYGIKCLPHYGMGMVMLVVVGAPENLEAVRNVRHPGRARGVFEALLDRVTAE